MAENNNQNKSVKDTASDVVAKAKKIKKIWTTVSAIFGSATIWGPIVIAILVVALLGASFSAFGEKILEFSDKLANFVTYGEFSKSEDAFFNTLKEEYVKYESTFKKEGHLDIALLASTVHYGQIINTQESDGSRNFYRVMQKELTGKHETVTNLTDNVDEGLIGALKTKKFIYTCVPGNGWDYLVNRVSTFFDMTEGVKEQIINATIKQIETTLDFTIGLPRTVFTKLLDLYADSEVNPSAAGYQAWVDSYISEFKGNYNDFLNILNISGNSKEVECEEEENILKGELTLVNDEEKYKDYLRTYFVPTFFIYCSKSSDLIDEQKMLDAICLYDKGDISKEEEQKKIDEIIDEIFDTREMYNYLLDDILEYLESLRGKYFGIYSRCQAITVTGDGAGTYPLEDYIAGVVANEMRDGFGKEALKAQAVAARSYVIKRTNNCTTPIENSEGTQTFDPNPFPEAVAATQATAGEVLTYDGEIILAEYANFPDERTEQRWGVNGRISTICRTTCPDDEDTCQTRLYRPPTYDSFMFEINKSVFRGGKVFGSGHCIGMTQYGAKDLEINYGYSYQEILEVFYDPKVELSQLKSLGKEGLIAGNYDGYVIRNKIPSSEDYPLYRDFLGGSRQGQCVWYVKGRAEEILKTIDIDPDIREIAINAILATKGDARKWWENEALSIFGSTDDPYQPQVGSVIVWEYTPQKIKEMENNNYGHVAIVEDIDADGILTITEAYRVKFNKKWDYTRGWQDVRWFSTRCTVQDILERKGNIFLGYIHLLG